MEKLFIVIPAYNEETNIKNVIADWYPIIEKYSGNGQSRLLIIDDGSKDSTYQILCEESKNKPLLQPIKKKNAGHGSTIYYGYHYAISNGADFVFQTDSDRQTLPEEFEAFWNDRHQYDMIIGNRKKRQDGFSRKIVAKVLQCTIKICFGVWVPDANTPYRLVKGKTLKELMSDIPKEFNLTNVLLTVLCFKKKKRIKYIMITFRQRQSGINSIDMHKIISIGIQAIRDFIQINNTLRKS